MVLSDRYACRLIEGLEPLAGGRLYSSVHWVVEHCTGPLGVGTLIVKPVRHCLHMGELILEEAQEFGPLLRRPAKAVQDLVNADRVYVCSWAHAGWKAGHIHFVVQPVWNHLQAVYARPGPTVQSAMFQAGNLPPIHEVEAFCQKARRYLAQCVPAAPAV